MSYVKLQKENNRIKLEKRKNYLSNLYRTNSFMTKKYENFFQDFLKPRARKAPTKTITKKNYKIRKTLKEDQIKEPTVEEKRIKEPKKIDQVMTPDWAILAMSACARQPNLKKYYIFN